MDAIVQYILSLVPASTAIIGMIVTIVVGISKIKKSTRDATKIIRDMSDDNNFLKKELKKLSQENLELKKQLDEVMMRMKHLYFVEKDGEIKEKGE